VLTRAAATLAVGWPAQVLADHGGGDLASRPGPIGVALIWDGVAFVVGMLVVALIARFSRREKPQP
jgi:hypothetical protein